MRRRTRLALLISAFAILVTGFAPAQVAASAAPASTGLPSDPAASGYIGLCDESGHNVTSGNVDSVPFVWKAVASTTPPGQFQGTGQNVVLNAYQPRVQVPPTQWSGAGLTAASFYSTSAHPTAQATYADESLASFVARFPPQVNGLYVLRMYYGKQGYGLYSRTYPSTTIQVVGHRWTVISGGTVDCGAGRAVSNEQLTGVVTHAQVTPRSASQRPASAGATSGSASATTGGATPGPITATPVALAAGGGVGTTSSAPNQASAAAPGDGGSAWLWGIAGAAIVVAAAALLWRRRSGSDSATT